MSVFDTVPGKLRQEGHREFKVSLGYSKTKQNEQ